MHLLKRISIGIFIAIVAIKSYIYMGWTLPNTQSGRPSLTPRPSATPHTQTRRFGHGVGVRGGESILRLAHMPAVLSHKPVRFQIIMQEKTVILTLSISAIHEQPGSLMNMCEDMGRRKAYSTNLAQSWRRERVF